MNFEGKRESSSVDFNILMHSKTGEIYSHPDRNNIHPVANIENFAYNAKDPLFQTLLDLDIAGEQQKCCF